MANIKARDAKLRELEWHDKSIFNFSIIQKDKVGSNKLRYKNEGLLKSPA